MKKDRSSMHQCTDQMMTVVLDLHLNALTLHLVIKMICLICIKNIFIFKIKFDFFYLEDEVK